MYCILLACCVQLHKTPRRPSHQSQQLTQLLRLPTLLIPLLALRAVTVVSGPASLLHRLRCPTRLELSRKGKIEKPCTSTGKAKQHKAGAANPTDPKGISPSIRVKEFPGECLRVRNGKLFCVACREELALKRVPRRTT